MFACAPAQPSIEMIGHDFRKVGDLLESAMQVESPKIESEIARQKAQQLDLPLTGRSRCVEA